MVESLFLKVPAALLQPNLRVAGRQNEAPSFAKSSGRTVSTETPKGTHDFQFFHPLPPASAFMLFGATILGGTKESEILTPHLSDAIRKRASK